MVKVRDVMLYDVVHERSLYWSLGMFHNTCVLLLKVCCVPTDTPDTVSKELVEAELVDGRDRIVGKLITSNASPSER